VRQLNDSIGKSDSRTTETARQKILQSKKEAAAGKASSSAGRGQRSLSPGKGQRSSSPGRGQSKFTSRHRAESSSPGSRQSRFEFEQRAEQVRAKERADQ
jgi:hypothetical protein